MADKYFGKYSGIVRENADDEKRGHLRVTVPSIFPEDVLMKARPALPYGLFFVPEVDAKVWVEFEGGDPGLPIWTGLQYVPGEWPGGAENEPPQNRLVRTASGHVILFRDGPDEEAVEIQVGVHGHTITLDREGLKVTDGLNKHELILSDRGVELRDGVNDHRLSLTSQGITLESAADVVIKGKTITLDATSRVAAKGPEVSIEADAQLTAKGNPIHLNP